MALEWYGHVVVIHLVIAILLLAPFVNRDGSMMDSSLEETTYDPTPTEQLHLSKNQDLDGSFIENRGQVEDDGVEFYALMPEGRISFLERKILYTLVEPNFQSNFLPEESGSRPSYSPYGPLCINNGYHGACNVLLSFEGANKVVPEGMEERSHYRNFITGSEMSDWQIGVSSYDQICYEQLYSGIDLVYRFRNGMLKYEFIQAPIRAV